MIITSEKKGIHDTILILKNPTTIKTSSNHAEIRGIKVREVMKIRRNIYCCIDLGSSVPDVQVQVLSSAVRGSKP